MEDIRRLIEYVEHAEHEIDMLMMNVEDARGYKGIHKRAYTIIGKLEELKWQLVDKQRGRR